MSEGGGLLAPCNYAAWAHWCSISLSLSLGHPKQQRHHLRHLQSHRRGGEPLWCRGGWQEPAARGGCRPTELCAAAVPRGNGAACFMVCLCSVNNSDQNAPLVPTAIASWCASHLQLEYLDNCIFSVTGPDRRRHCSDSQWNGAANVRPTYCWRNRGFHGRRPKQCQVIWLLVQPKAVNCSGILNVSR